MLDLTDLRVFARIADLKSISEAARALKAPKSSVSRSLARLEEAVGSVLIERSTRHVRLTDAGTLFYPHALRILNDVDEAETALGRFAGAPRGTLRVNATYAVTHRMIAPMLPAFLARYPEVRVVVDVDNRRIDLPVEAADLVLRLGSLADSGLVARRLASLEIWACASPAYLAARGTPTSVEELHGHDLVGRNERSRWTFHTADGGVEELEFESRVVVPEPAAAQVVLSGGVGIGLLPDYLAADAIASGQLVRVLAGLRHPPADVHALYPSHRSLSAKVRVFIDALAAHLEATRATARR